MSFLFLAAAYFHMHIGSNNFSKKLKVVLPHHLSILLGLGSLSWSAHQFHISAPVLKLISAGVDPGLIPSPYRLLSLKVMSYVDPYNFSSSSTRIGFFGTYFYKF